MWYSAYKHNFEYNFARVVRSAEESKAWLNHARVWHHRRIYKRSHPRAHPTATHPYSSSRQYQTLAESCTTVQIMRSAVAHTYCPQPDPKQMFVA